LLSKDEARRIAVNIAKLPHIGEPRLILQRRGRVVGPVLFIEVLSDLYFDLPLMAASSGNIRAIETAINNLMFDCFK
jgi:hypothetical protein